MKVLLAGATGTLGIPLAHALVAGSHEVIGLSRTPDKGESLRALGAEPVIADVMDQTALLNAVDGLEADAVVHQATALKKIPMRHRDMAATNALREAGTTNMLAAARVVGARRFVTQSFLTGYGYGDWGDKVLTEDDPFAPPGRIRAASCRAKVDRTPDLDRRRNRGDRPALRLPLRTGRGHGVHDRDAQAAPPAGSPRWERGHLLDLYR